MISARSLMLFPSHLYENDQPSFDAAILFPKHYTALQQSKQIIQNNANQNSMTKQWYDVRIVSLSIYNSTFNPLQFISLSIIIRSATSSILLIPNKIFLFLIICSEGGGALNVPIFYFIWGFTYKESVIMSLATLMGNYTSQVRALLFQEVLFFRVLYLYCMNYCIIWYQIL